ncbi:unnamed protein product, partial [Allacma fusca]
MSTEGFDMTEDLSLDLGSPIDSTVSSDIEEGILDSPVPSPGRIICAFATMEIDPEIPEARGLSIPLQHVKSPETDGSTAKMVQNEVCTEIDTSASQPTIPSPIKAPTPNEIPRMLQNPKLPSLMSLSIDPPPNTQRIVRFGLNRTVPYTVQRWREPYKKRQRMQSPPPRVITCGNHEFDFAKSGVKCYLCCGTGLLSITTLVPPHPTPM